MCNHISFRLPTFTSTPTHGHLQLGENTNPSGDWFDINSRWLEFNGHPCLPIMGEFHYTRCPAEMWEDELKKVKAGGITLLATYVFWIHHEERDGVFDWSGNRNLRQFLKLASEAGLMIAIRIGPFCHGECRNGGIPDWMYGQPFEIRSNDSRYLSIVERLYRQIYAQVEGMFFSEGGPIIAVQVENEYLSTGAPWETTHIPDTEWQTAGAGGENHMMILQQMAEEIGFNPVLWTCTGWGNTRFATDRFFPMFGGYAYYGWQDDPENHELSGNYIYRDAPSAKTPNRSPNCYDPTIVPYACCEIGGGMQVFYRHRPIVPAQSVEAMNNVILANGSNLMGTYVYHGGVNPDSEGGGWLNEHRCPRRSYDFQAPLGEYGQRRPHYDLLRRLYYFIQYTERILPRMVTVVAEDEPVDKNDLKRVRAGLRADAEGRGFLFLNNFQDHADMEPKYNVTLLVKTPGEDIVFPATGQINLASGQSMILPINLELGGITLKQAGVQLITSRRDPDLPERFFFFTPSGIESPYYRFSGRVIIDGLDASEIDGDTIVCPPTECRSHFGVIANNRRIEITTLTEAESKSFWQGNIGGEIVNLLTDAGVMFHTDGFDLYQIDNNEFRFEILSHRFLIDQKAEQKRDRSGFERYCFSMPKWQGAIEVTTLKTGKAHITLGHNAFDGVSDIFLRVNYHGDTGMAFLDGKMIHDNFNNGTTWEIGLKQYKGLIEEKGVVLRVLPKPCQGGSCTQDAMGAGAVTGGDFSDLYFERIAAVPEYRIRLKS